MGVFKIKHKKIILASLLIFIFTLINVIGPSSLYFNSSEKYGIVYASPRGGFHSGSFSSHSSSGSSSSKSFRSGSFSNSSKSSGSKSYNSSSGSSGQTTKRSYIPIPIPIPFGHSSYGRGYYGGGLISFIFKFILFIVVVVLIYKFLKKRRR